MLQLRKLSPSSGNLPGYGGAGIGTQSWVFTYPAPGLYSGCVKPSSVLPPAPLLLWNIVFLPNILCILFIWASLSG